jgi:hypothetical protein
MGCSSPSLSIYQGMYVPTYLARWEEGRRGEMGVVIFLRWVGFRYLPQRALFCLWWLRRDLSFMCGFDRLVI